MARNYHSSEVASRKDVNATDICDHNSRAVTSQVQQSSSVRSVEPNARPPPRSAGKFAEKRVFTMAAS